MKRIVLGLVVTSLLFFSCKKSKELPADYLVFGTFYNGCESGCLNFFQISNDQLYAAMPGYSLVQTQSQVFSSEPLPAEKYEIARELVSDFPEYLRNSSEEIFGCPDCTDQGGLYLERRQNGVVRKWKIDPADHPDEISAYVMQVFSIVHQLDE